jgi:hypothetical protein
MIDEEILSDIINDFTEEPKYKFLIKDFKYFMGPENQETLFVTLIVKEKITDIVTYHLTLSQIKRRLLNLLSLNRVLLYCDLESNNF